MKLKFPINFEKKSLNITDEKINIFSDFPVVLTVLHGRSKKARYDIVEEKGDTYIGKALISINKENQFEVIDTWEKKEKYFELTRNVKCIKASKGAAIRVSTEFRCYGEGSKSFDDYQFIIPSALYNKNDTDLDGQDDYLGTFDQDYKDDRNPALSETCYCKKADKFIALIRGDIPQYDETITREQIEERHFIHSADIGSLGLAPSPYKTNEFLFRCDYPFYERNSFCLNVDASEWAAYKAIEEGTQFKVSYILLVGNANNLTEASWETTAFQMGRIMNSDIKLPFTLEEAKKYRAELLYNSFREFPDQEGCPAGFIVHFSPREKYGSQNLLEYGFSGNQTMVCYSLLRSGEEQGRSEYRESVLKTLEFFTNHCIAPSGLPYAMYNADKGEFVFWETGILLPFQYADSREELEEFLGEQVVGSVIAIAEQLKQYKGNYSRTMVEAMYYLLLCYLHEKKNGIEHSLWLEVVTKFCDKMIEIQNKDGSWYRAYTMEGEPILEPVEWFGVNDLERGSGAIFPSEVMVLLYKCTGKDKYLKAACKAADFIIDTYVDEVLYIGGLNDTTHKKSVKIDAVGVMYNMRTLLLAYEGTKEKKYLSAAKAAARILSSWVFLWDSPFDKKTTLGKYGFKTTGWAGCDVIPGGSYVDDEFPEFVPDLMKIAEYCKDKELALIGKIVTLGMHHGFSMPQNDYGYALMGIQGEGFLTSLWLSDTSYRKFSGGAAKNKGDDNDTCNGLTNAQALCNLYFLEDEYGTINFDELIDKIMD